MAMLSNHSDGSLPDVAAAVRRQRARRGYRKSGAFALKRAIRTLGSRTIDRRTRVGRALAAWCADLALDLGGLEALSTAQRAIVEQAATTRLILDSIDGWLAKQPSLIDRRKRALLPVVRERQSLADALVRYLMALGLERRARELPDLASYISTRPSPVTDDVQREGDGAPGREARNGVGSDAAAENERGATLESSDARHARTAALDAEGAEPTA